ncbi:GAF domain-containing sensor histidine kinase [Acidaminobacter sp. JC074]|uniref:GAF domain-containing sensor histidine kinase n=1 Tax=Acidaminobacter sp. JC074 TaxID=2530199 RepID=UPI001F113B03|nr:GAF domain-containing sensor histidine kinase [Acidaminobacter sp. JC074]MCH4887062.1 GAF domain-containing sensor histidine kinase [Acidaminobacter sp. JC074]
MNPKLKVRGKEERVEVKLNEPLANALEKEIADKWQEILDLAVQMYGIPAALIMKLHEDDLEIYAKSSNEENFFVKNKHTSIGVGHYCETVLGNDDMLFVKDANEDPFWEDSPDVKANMINYLGLPLKWPGGESFGTMCMLDSEVNDYTKEQIELFVALKNNIEKDLTLLDSHEKLQDSLDELQKTHDLLIEHEKNHLTNKLVSSISHEISTPLHVALTAAEYLDYVIEKLDEKVPLDKLQEGTSLVHKNIEEAANLIKSFKKIASDQGHQRIDVINLNLYIKHVISGLKYDIRKYNLHVDTRVDENILIKTYPGTLSQVIIELLIHGIFTRCGEETHLSIYYEDNKLIFEDDGMEIDSEVIKDLFKPFSEIDVSKETSGLGLAIVKEMVEKILLGKISCTSNEKTQFIIEIHNLEEA